MDFINWLQDWAKAVWDVLGVEGFILILIGFFLAKMMGFIRGKLPIVIIVIVTIIIAIMYYGVQLPEPNSILNNLSKFTP